MDVQVKVVNLGPFLFDPAYGLFNSVRRGKAHGIHQGTAYHLNTGLVPAAVLRLEHSHLNFNGKLTEKIRTPSRADAYPGFFDLFFHGPGHDLGPPFDFLLLGPVGVPPGEYVTQMAGQARIGGGLNGQGRRIFAGSFNASRVHQYGRVGHTGFGLEP